MQQYIPISVILTIFAFTTACAEDERTGDELAETGDTGSEPECTDCEEPRPAPTPSVCGDAVCDLDEDCSTCADDCGGCLDCREAPSCEGAAIPGVIEAHLEALDILPTGDDMQPLVLDRDQLAPLAASASEHCDPAKLRIRVAKIIVHDEHDLVMKDNVYCAIVSEAASGAEIKVTPVTSKLGDGEEYVYALAQGVIWGQLGEPVAPHGDLLITYNCFEADDTGAFEEFLDAIGDAALGADPIPGAYGWIVPVVGLAAEIIGAALALEKDDHLINVAQVIPAELQLEMTNGVWWSVERSGAHNLENWHWELRMEAWGCTDDGLP